MAGFVWWTGMIGLALLTIWVLIADLWLARNGLSMVTDYLRRHPWAFWGGAIPSASGITALAVHLFIQASNGRH